MKPVLIAASALSLLLAPAAMAATKKPARPAAAKAQPASARPKAEMPVPEGATQLPPVGAKAAPGAADWREVDAENTLVIDTNKGRVIVELVPEAAPKHVARLKELTRKKVYDGLVFFRVIDMFMAQTGDPQNTGSGSTSEPNLMAEFTFRRGPDMDFAPVANRSGVEEGFVRSLPVVTQSDSYMSMTSDHKAASWGTYCPGVIGMARDEAPDSANSQFFLMRQSYPSLDKRYTAFGRVVSGLDVVRAIKTGEPVTDPDRMVLVRVLADIPAPDRPHVRVLDTHGAAFKELVGRVRAARGADFSVCDIELPVNVTGPQGGAAVSP